MQFLDQQAMFVESGSYNNKPTRISEPKSSLDNRFGGLNEFSSERLGNRQPSKDKNSNYQQSFIPKKR